MTALFVVVPLALLVTAGFLFAFSWSVRGGQMDDLDTPALRALEDETEGRYLFKAEGAGVKSEGRVPVRGQTGERKALLRTARKSFRSPPDR